VVDIANRLRDANGKHATEEKDALALLKHGLAFQTQTWLPIVI
jgi:hypothetical protein